MDNFKQNSQLGFGAFGAVDRMLHQPSMTELAVKVSSILDEYNIKDLIIQLFLLHTENITLVQRGRQQTHRQ